MANNTTLNTGTGGDIIAAKDVNSAGVKYQVVVTEPHLLTVAASAMTRPANTTAYAANDAVSNNGTAGSVTAISFTLADLNDQPISIERMRIASTDTGVKSKSFRVFLYQSDPTASTGIVGGDNAAFSTKQGAFIGSLVGTFRSEFSDGAVGEFLPEFGSRIISAPTSGARTIFALLQTLEAFTPSANSTTFTCTLEAIQGRA